MVYDNAPGDKWIRKDPDTGEMFVRERWLWPEEGKPQRAGWLVAEGRWAEGQVPYGAANVANSRRPQPHRIEAFDNPENQAKETIALLKKVLEDSIKNLKENEDKQDINSYTALIQQLGGIQRSIVEKTKGEITQVESRISDIIHEVFPGYQVSFDARAEEELENCITFFKASPKLLMGPADGHLSSVEHQGSGARRTLLWAALRILREQGRQGKNDRPHLLLLDEPELCLHPTAIREACRVLYDLPKTGNWQVMVTTHSPVFIDLSRDNTSIVRVERRENGAIQSTTLFRPMVANLDEDDRARLKLLNLCDPYVAEFFFGGNNIVVEGDTEYTALKYVIANCPNHFKDVHIIRARGKASIVSLCKILNHFGAGYAVLHDSDHPKAKRKGKEITNPAWTQNTKILDIVAQAPDRKKIRLVASIPNVEGAYFGDALDGEKPYNALLQMSEGTDAFNKTLQLLEALVDHSKSLPDGAFEWTNIEELKAKLV
ncbi:MAG: ATP-dependent endonuclease [Vampirovibrio sp.]|nr:ATP-dependent endonuclease [Vampirovibrio sp.]